MKMIKIVTLFLVLILVLAGCSSQKEEETPVVPAPSTDVTEETAINIESKDGVSFDLKLNKTPEEVSEIVAVATNNSDKLIKTIKITVNFVSENVNRILYLAQDVEPNQTSQPFFISGPKSNDASDVVVSDIVVTFDEETAVVPTEPTEPTDPTEPTEPNEPEPAPEPKPEPEPEPEPSPISDEAVAMDESKTLNLFRFEEFILQMADLPPTIGLVDNQIVVSFKNNSDLTITGYTIKLNVNGTPQTFRYEGSVAPGASSPQFGFVESRNASLAQISGEALTVVADYENNSKLTVEYDLVSPKASYRIQ